MKKLVTKISIIDALLAIIVTVLFVIVLSITAQV